MVKGGLIGPRSGTWREAWRGSRSGVRSCSGGSLGRGGDWLPLGLRESSWRRRLERRRKTTSLGWGWPVWGLLPTAIQIFRSPSFPPSLPPPPVLSPFGHPGVRCRDDGGRAGGQEHPSRLRGPAQLFACLLPSRRGGPGTWGPVWPVRNGVCAVVQAARQRGRACLLRGGVCGSLRLALPAGPLLALPHVHPGCPAR